MQKAARKSERPASSDTLWAARRPLLLLSWRSLGRWCGRLLGGARCLAGFLLLLIFLRKLLLTRRDLLHQRLACLAILLVVDGGAGKSLVKSIERHREADRRTGSIDGKYHETTIRLQVVDDLGR